MNSNRNRMRAVALLALAGTPAYVLCFLWHICMDGHMAHGEDHPYPVYHWINDIWWVTCFASVMVFSLRMNAKGKLVFLIGSFVLIVSRFSLGEMAIELPLLGLVNIYAICSLVQPSQFERVRPSPPLS